tara:strand:- start:164 stop:928 length:765 start_codon:yes stop_codon:yes gene_type:complete
MNLKKTILKELETVVQKTKGIEFWNDSSNLDKIISIIESIPNLSNKKRFYKRIKPNTHDLYRDNYYKFCIENLDKYLATEGMFIEMGVFKGQTIKLMNKFKKELFPNAKESFYGFDSFEGLPEDWKPGSPKGKFKTNKIPKIEGCKMVVGWFEDTLPTFVVNNKNKKIALLHIDCDLYSSTKTTLKYLDEFITEGTVILLDEIIGSKDHLEHEYKAFKEYLDENNIEIEWLAYIANAAQAACKITKKGEKNEII